MCMHLCVRVHVHVRVFVHVYGFAYMHTHTRMHTGYVRLSVCMRTRLCVGANRGICRVDVDVEISMHTRVHIYTYIGTRSCAKLCAFTSTCACACAFICLCTRACALRAPARMCTCAFIYTAGNSFHSRTCPEARPETARGP